MDLKDLARWRLHTLRLAGPTFPDPLTAVEALLGVQAENYAHTLWALATRTDDTTRDDLQRLFDEGAILRTHVLRPTWHVARPDDLRWLVEVTAPRVRRSWSQLQRTLELDAATLDRSLDQIVGALSGGVHLTRDALAEHLRESGLPAQGPALGVMLANAESLAAICSGALQDGAQTYALLDERAPAARRLDRDEALAEIALRYFRGHGPATERDLSYWASLTLRDVRVGLAAVDEQLDRIVVDGRTCWFGQPPPAGTDFDPRAHLLLTLDEYHNGYQDSRYSLDVAGIVPRGRGANVGMTLVDGQMVGDMRRTVGSDSVTFDVGLFRDLTADEADAVGAAAERCAAFLGVGDVRLRLLRR
jgi:hypothetical protein